MSSWFQQADEISGIRRENVSSRVLNNTMGDDWSFIIHIDSVEDFQNGSVMSISEHWGLNNPMIVSNPYTNGAIHCTYDQSCPVCQFVDKLKRFEGSLFDYIREELGVQNKPTDTDFWKTYKETFQRIKSPSPYIKIIPITTGAIFKNQPLKTGLLRMSPGLLSVFKAMATKHPEYFTAVEKTDENGKTYLDRGNLHKMVVSIKTNGKQGMHLKYDSWEIEQPKDFMEKIIPKWDDKNFDRRTDVGNFDFFAERISNTAEEINEAIGEFVKIETAQDLIEIIHKIMEENKNKKPTSSEDESEKKGKSVLEKFSSNSIDPTKNGKQEEAKKDVAKTKEEKVEAVLTNEEKSFDNENSDDALDELASGLVEVENSVQEKQEDAPTGDQKIFLSVSDTKGKSKEDWLNLFKKIVDENDSLENPFSQKDIDLLRSTFDDPSQAGVARKAVQAHMDGNDLLYF